MVFLDREKIIIFLKEDLKRAFRSPTIVIMCLITGSVVFTITMSVYSVLISAKDDRLKAIETKHEGIVKEYEIRLENQKDFIEYQSSLVSEYRERLGLIPANGNPYSKLTHKELKDKTLELVDEIWPFLIEYKEKEQSIHNEWLKTSRNYALSPEKNKDDWDNYMSKNINLYFEFQNDFRKKFSKDFSTNILLLREEILSRIPQEKIDTMEIASWSKAKWMLQTSSVWTQEFLQELVMLAKRLESEN